jgi:hypothetical protein
MKQGRRWQEKKIAWLTLNRLPLGLAAECRLLPQFLCIVLENFFWSNLWS